MADVAVALRPQSDGWMADVIVRESETETLHAVRIARRDYERLASGRMTPEELVRRSFEFLLEREPKESILKEFDLTAISRYFPGYEREMARGIRD